MAKRNEAERAEALKTVQRSLKRHYMNGSTREQVDDALSIAAKRADTPSKRQVYREVLAARQRI